jgi:short-subunit dehydrogenase
MRIKHSVVVITGASSGIGRATALTLAKKRAVVVLAGRGEEALEEVSRQCHARGGEALAVPTDVTDAAAVVSLASRTVNRYGRLDAWINAAAVAAYGAFGDLPLDDFRRVLEVNIMGTVHGARAALPYMRDQDRGVLVNLSSVVGIVAQPYSSAYAMSKAAVRALSSSLRQELWIEGANGVDVCTVLPASIDTPIYAHAANYTGRAASAMHPVYSPERVAHEIVGLLHKPRREVIVGPVGRAVAWQSKLTPQLAEAVMAVRVERGQFSRTRPAVEGPGNLYEPAAGQGATHGEFHGRRRTAVRRALTAALVTGAVAAATRAVRGPRR